MNNAKNVRIGMFIDGMYAQLVSEHYHDQQPIRKHIIPSGFMYFLRVQIAEYLGVSFESTAIIEAHFYIGLHKVDDLESIERLEKSLSRSGIRLHTYPIKLIAGRNKEVGVDTALAFDTARLAIESNLDVVIFVTGDGDFIPVAKGLREMKKTVVLPYWTIGSRGFWANADLVRQADVRLDMFKVIEYGIKHDIPDILAIFRPWRPAKVDSVKDPPKPKMKYLGIVEDIEGDHGYVTLPFKGERFLFFKENVWPPGADFADFTDGCPVRFIPTRGAHGEDIAVEVEVLAK